ncbi:MAG: Cytochrome c [Acidobacteria bacterium]|nr:Cytochrome c [Acidobacteriota bacterium]
MSATRYAAVLLAVTAAGAAGCAKPAATAAAPDAEAIERGRRIYATEACAACHGAGRRGSDVAPSLWNLGRHWDEERMVAFLRDPVAYRAHDSRMAEVAARYPADMPAVATGDAGKLRDLAHYLLHE